MRYKSSFKFKFNFIFWTRFKKFATITFNGIIAVSDADRGRKGGLNNDKA